MLSPYRISYNFGKEIALDVRAVTKMEIGKETVDLYLRRIIARGAWAIAVKLCDRLHNIRSLDSSSKKKRKRQIKETNDYYLDMLIPALKKCGKTWIQLAEKLNVKINEALETIIEQIQG